MTCKLAIITEIIAPYRIPVFNELAKRPEIDLHVIFLAETDPTLRQWHVYKDEIRFSYEVLPGWRRRIGRYNVLLNRKVAGALNRLQPDVVLCGGYNYLASWTAAWWAAVHRTPLMLWSESTALDQRRRLPFVEFLKMRYIERCAAFVVPGQASLNYLNSLGIAAERIFVAPNAVENSLFCNLANLARANPSQVRDRYQLPLRYFLYAGRLVREKGIGELLDAYAQLEPEIRSNVELLLVGNGQAREDLDEKAAKITPGRVRWLGFMHREQLAEVYALAEAFIFPSHSDTWGLVVNEAMACGLPVVVTNVSGCTADLVQDGLNGFVVFPGNTSQISSSMASLAKDEELRRKMGQSSSAKVELYSPAAWAAGVVEAAKSVCATKFPTAA